MTFILIPFIKKTKAQFRQFIHLKFKLTDSNRWISFGGSYPGSLSGENKKKQKSFEIMKSINKA